MAVTIAAASGCGSGPEEIAHAPHIEFESTDADPGLAQPGKPLRATFTFRNAGERPLIIERVRAGCGMRAQVEPGSQFAPGETGRVTVDLSAPQGLDEQSLTATVYANDPQQPVTSLSLRTRNAADIAANPDQLYVGSVQRGQVAPLPIRLPGHRGILARSVESRGAVLAASLTTSRDQQQVRVRIRPDAPIGHFTETLVVRTSSAKVPELNVSVTGIVERGPT